ncbi:NUDIX domain-containing protein [Ammonicoccus fulvus]|uniref:NUDIX domain-containing protein n=1 Tax=Ammonicoccus fulvus TaxID=3138240 RepID=A0ABZ3FPJ7_9ACTN
MSQADAPKVYVPLPPNERPKVTRAAVRVVVLADERVLLFEDSDPAYAHIRWWVTPGGGIDPGETEAEAAVRELWEETGLRIAEHDLIGPVSRRVAEHGYSDQILEQSEAFYIVRVDHFDVDITGHTVDEQLTLQSHRWWPVAELADTELWIWPRYLLDLIDLADRPGEWPVDYGHETDESTLAI